MICLCSSLSLLGLKAQDKALAKSLFATAKEQLFLKGQCTKILFDSSILSRRGEEQARYEGSIYIQGEDFCLEYGHILAVYSGGLLTYVDDNQEVFSISRPSKDELLQINPFYFIHSEAKGFKLEDIKQEREHYILRFTPPSADFNIKDLSIYLGLKNKDVSRVKIQATDGMFILLRLRHQSYEKAKASSLFQLKKEDYPQYELVDLR